MRKTPIRRLFCIGEVFGDSNPERTASVKKTIDNLKQKRILKLSILLIYLFSISFTVFQVRFSITIENVLNLESASSLIIDSI